MSTRSPSSTMSRIAAATAILLAVLATSVFSPTSTTNVSLLLTRFQRALAKNLRAPEGRFNFLGWAAARIMQATNVISNHEMIDILLQYQQKNLHDNMNKNNNEIQDKIVWVELGPGNGMSMEYLLPKLLSHNIDQTKTVEIHAFEISERFRNIMQTKFSSDIASALITLHGEDAKDIASVLQQKHHQQQLPTSSNANSVNAIYGANVVYFLKPLHEYIEVFYNILRPGGMLLFGVQNTAQGFSDTPEFANTDWDEILQDMRKAGFVHVEQRASFHPGKAERTFYLMGFKSDN
jgi:hypothetical protein